MMNEAIYEDEITRQTESPLEFEKSGQLFKEADALNYVNKGAEAEKKYREVMDATRAYGVYYHLAQGQIYILHDNLDYALTAFEIASTINDQIDSVHINLGLTYRKIAGRLRSFNILEKANNLVHESLAAFERAIELNPNNPGAWSTKAITYLSMGKKYLEEAEKCINTALKLDPNNYSALTNLSKLRRLQGNREEARALALQAITINPDNAFAYSLLGARKDKDTEPLESKPQKSIEWLQKALERDPDNSFLFGEMGKAYRDLQDYGESIKWFDRFVKVEGERNYGAFANRGNIYLKMGEFELAEADLRQSLSIRTDYSFALSALRDLLKKQNRFEESFHVAERITRLSNTPQNHRQFQELTKLYQKDRSESIALTRGLVQSKANVKSAETLQQAEKALRLYSQNHDAWGLMGRSYAANGNYQLARTYLDKALTLNPDAYFYRIILGQVFEELGDLKAAEREYRLFVARNDRSERGQDALRRINNKLRQEERKKAISVSGPEIVFLNNKTGREEHHSVKLIREFLYDRMKDWNLPISEIIEEIGDDPVFIIAKTGVGKTVTVPTKVLLELCDRLLEEGTDLSREFPQVYVVEPRIPICTMTMAEMNDGYQSYMAYRMIDDPQFRDFASSQGLKELDAKDSKTVSEIIKLAYEYLDSGKAPYDPRHFNLYGCITSATGKINADAPILFVTTGIIESLTFEESELDPKFNRIIIDEAHVTIEANPSIELGIALARKKGVKIDYMSATVDPATLAQDLDVKIVYAGTQRFPIYLTNLHATVEDSILDLVENFLLEPQDNRFPNPNDFTDPKVRTGIESVRLHLLSREAFQEGGKTHPGLNQRAQGMLVIVNSHQSENSDTHRIADLIARADFNSPVRQVHTLRLASPVVRDPAQKLAFDRLIKKIEDENGRYVIVATNVVEMGLTFSSLDYVVTMDSEFDTLFVDGSQMITKVELGINALYQRIGRAGRIRPGVAFIAKDFGASYSELDDRSLSAGLKVAPIRYPLAKGSFLKLALYSFREKMLESTLREQIASLNLPSRIHENNELWSRFEAERSRLKRIGIASGEELTSIGRAALTFIGLDDMDYAKLLASVIHEYGENSDLAVIFTVLAAASEFSFESLMVKKYFLTNTQQLSAMEIIHEDALGVPASDAYKLIKQHENDADKLHAALQVPEIDDQLCNDICTFVRAGYRLVYREEIEEEQSLPIQDSSASSRSNEFEMPNDEDDALDEDELSDNIRNDLDMYSAKHTLGFERSVVSFNDQSELINIYRIFRHFFNNYFSQLKSRTLNALESSELRQAMEYEAGKLQISTRTLNDLNNRFSQLCRHVDIEILREETAFPSEFQLTMDERKILLEATIRGLLFERKGNDDDLDLCLRFFELVGSKGKLQPKDLARTVRSLEEMGFETSEDQVKELWFLIIRESQRRYIEQSKQFIVSDSREVLPPLTRGLESELLRLVRKTGYHSKLNFTKGDFGFTTNVRDQFGTSIEIRLPDDNNPLGPSLLGRDDVTVLAKLTPAMMPKVMRDDEDQRGFTMHEEKGFRISHITLLN
jgi:tetratricopeptide (TPR) repeat protein